MSETREEAMENYRAQGNGAESQAEASETYWKESSCQLPQP